MTEKLDLNGYIPEGWQGRYPPCQIQVNNNGELLHNGAPLVHPGIIELIYQSVHLDEDGVYYLYMDGKKCQLEVADTFFVITRVDIKDDNLVLTVSDGSKQELDPASLYIGKDEVLYCRVHEGRFPARFQRAAYYQITDWVKETEAGFALSLGGRLHPLPGTA
ncbi:DUF1285 domain-containing protein [Dethiosulfatarculus sandiegensis]|uniref:DUF1285 domain-containing protein n=1 Tax=Dethiosulfatarculus sandiegensis TaxID=1429043 RepID=A0A0D2HSM4_9BACT|nr:DUF1285 domain-containing protein [Dethiosulfatarculus sandiegensis]KIX13503.1 hypothetical protein X474_13540 [Dethiosulfatarculus sandiegensis]